MRRLIAALTLAAIPLAPAEAQDQMPPEWAAFVGRAVDLVIVPAFAALDESAAELSASLGDLCAAPSEMSFDGAAAAFEDTVIAFAHVMVLPVAPVLAENRRDRFLFWPDPRGITQRQVQPVLAEHDETATSLETLVGKSAALQGLGALEHVLFGTGAESILAGDEDGQFRCAYAMAIGENLVSMASDMAAAMAPDGEFARMIRNPGPGNPLYPTADAAITDLIIGTEEGIELARNSLLVPVLGQSIELARPRAAPLWRSGLTVAFLGALIDATREMIEVAEIGAILPVDSQWIMESVAWELSSIASVDLPAAGTLDLVATDEEFRQLLFRLVAYTDNLKSLLGLSIPLAIGLSAAFFANEG